MINGAHFLIFSKDADADRDFVRDVLGLRFVDVGHGWLIFALPPSELALHPAEANLVQHEGDHTMMAPVLYLMCDDLGETIKSLAAKNVKCGEVAVAPWGSHTTIPLPSGAELGLYQPSHQTAHDLKTK